MHFSMPPAARPLVACLLAVVLVALLISPAAGDTVPSPDVGKDGATLAAKATPEKPPVTTAKATATPTPKVTTTSTKPVVTRTLAPTTTAPRTTVPTTTVATTRTTPTTVRTTEPATVANLPTASAVVVAPTIVAGPFTVPPGTGIFSITSVGNVPVGGDGVVQLVVDNGWTPLFGDTYVDISWDPGMVAYRSSAIKVLNTTAAVSSDRSVRVMLGDFRRGYPQGRYPLASITLRALREGTSTLSVSVDHVRYWSNDFLEFTDITGSASARSGTFSTGPLPSETQPLVTFTQNTLAPSSYPPSDDRRTVATTGRTTTATTVATTTATTIATTTTVAGTVTIPPATATVTDDPNSSAAGVASANDTYAAVSTRVESSGLPAVVLVVSIGVVGGAAWLRRRRE